MAAPGPLDNLHDFYQPAPPAWTPQTPAWYVLFGVLSLALLWLVVHLVRRWFADRYRREALRELPALPLEQLSSLLKRTALSVWPREKIASLSGTSWLNFLNDSADAKLFDQAPENLIEDVAIRPSAVQLSNGEERALRAASAMWIRKHKEQRRRRVQA